jgi:hypothetical protein
MNPSLELSCRHSGDRYPFHGGLGHCVVNSSNVFILELVDPAAQLQGAIQLRFDFQMVFHAIGSFGD